MGVVAIAAYLRVSSRAQTHAMQRDAISRACAARSEAIDLWFVETRSGGSSKRPELDRLVKSARAGELSKLYVFRVDRLTRRGIADTLAIVEELRGYGCRVATVADGFDLEGPAGEIVLAVMAWAAKVELLATGERISAARDRVETKGGRWGRPRKFDPGTLARAQEMLASGVSLRDIAVKLKIPRSTLSDALSQKGHYGK